MKMANGFELQQKEKTAGLSQNNYSNIIYNDNQK